MLIRNLQVSKMFLKHLLTNSLCNQMQENSYTYILEHNDIDCGSE